MAAAVRCGPSVPSSKYAASVACAEIESVKSVNDYYSPLDGTVIEVNPALADHPELVNQDPAKAGWFAKVKPAKADWATGLLNAAQYQALLKK